MTSRILVVDDSKVIRVAVTKLLEKSGMSVVAVDSAEEALRLLLDEREEFDLVISDLMMPGLNGNDLVTTIRAEPRIARLRVLILTASTETDDQLLNLESGASDYVQKGDLGPVLVARAERLLNEKRMEDQLERMSRTDPLTGLANRRYATSRLNEEIERAGRYGNELMVALLDIDHFKRVNDTFGHQAGDDVLVKVASELEAATRKSDLVVRWGGEEFLVICPETGLPEGGSMMERFRSHIASLRVAAAGEEVAVTVSGGVARLRDDDDAVSLVNRADQALYEAKDRGRNRLLAWRQGELVPVVA